MRKYAFPVMLALAGTLALGACSQSDNSAQSQQAAAEPANTGSSADCTQFASKLAAAQPASAMSSAPAAPAASSAAKSASTSTSAPSLKSGQGQVDAANGDNEAMAQDQDQDQGPQLSEADRKLQTGCYSYLSGLVQEHLKGMTANQPYAYLIPAGNNAAAISQRQRQLGNVSDVVQRGVTPGNLLAFAGPDSGMTATLLVTAFKGVPTKSLKGVIVVFVGDQADQQRVQAAVAPSAATFRFVAM